MIWFDAHCLEGLLTQINTPILILHSTKLDEKRKRTPIKNNEKINYIQFVKSLTSNVDVKVFNRYGIEKDDRALSIERDEIETLANDREAELGILNRNIIENPC